VLAELGVRFILGGLIVSLFSVTGELWKPKTFSGIFGAAPSVALASLALTFAKQGPPVVALLARSMVIGSVALYAYGAACVFATKQESWPVWLAALSSWLAWFAAALAGLGVGAALGARP
jgi:hypothetical protein